MPEFCGTGEIEELFGITRVQVWRLISAGDFPEPLARLRQGQVWRTADVREAMKRLHRSGRVTTDGRLVPHRFLADDWSEAEAVSQ